jgi:predicted nuclease of restriction endonuclease-like (RecB) superfamily
VTAKSADMPLDPTRLVDRLSYTHLEQLVELDDPLKRRFYEIESIRGNWSVRELKRQIATLYFERCGMTLNKEALSKLAHANAETQTAQQVIRDPYVFRIPRPQAARDTVPSEQRVEDTLIDKLQDFLLELGHGFCSKRVRSVSLSAASISSSISFSIIGF